MIVLPWWYVWNYPILSLCPLSVGNKYAYNITYTKRICLHIHCIYLHSYIIFHKYCNLHIQYSIRNIYMARSFIVLSINVLISIIATPPRHEQLYDWVCDCEAAWDDKGKLTKLICLISHISVCMITYPRWDWNQSVFVKRGQGMSNGLYSTQYPTNFNTPNITGV